MRKADKRVEVSIISPKSTILTAVIIMIYSGFLLKIFDSIHFVQENAYILAATILSLIIVSSVCIAAATGYYRYVNTTLPLLNLANAAREVAKGNYTIKLLPHRKDGQMDEIDALYEDFNTMVEELASTEMLKTSFVSNISHELKTPISVISNYSTLLQDSNITDEEKKRYAKKISQTSKDLADLIGNVLQISKLDNHQIEANMKMFDVSEELIQSILSFDSLLSQKNIDLQIDIPEGLYLESDAGLLRIAFQNILSNAIKFTDESGMIVVTVAQNATMTTIAVKDNGCGMDEKAIKHIFDKFYQADTSHSAKGNGLGLAMVRQIVALLDGSIDVMSAPGEGSMFTVSLPNTST